MKKFSFTPQSPVAILFMGQSGSGKGTQSKRLLEVLRPLFGGASSFATGDHVRTLSKEKTFAGTKAREINKKGLLQPLEWAVYFWMDFLKKELDQGIPLIIMDGSPRRIEEAQALKRILVDFYGMDVYVIHLIVPDHIAEMRIYKRALEEKREETATKEAIAEKLKWYHTDVLPALEWMEQSGAFKIISISGVPEDREYIHTEIFDALVKH